MQREFCETCRATVRTFRKKKFIYCENCSFPLFDDRGDEVIITYKKSPSVNGALTERRK